MNVRELAELLSNLPGIAEVRVATVDDDEGRPIASVEPANNLPGAEVKTVFLREQPQSDLPRG